MFSENTTTTAYVKLEETSEPFEENSSNESIIEENLEYPQEEFKEEHQEVLSDVKEPEQTHSVEITPSEPTTILKPNDNIATENTANKCMMGCCVM